MTYGRGGGQCICTDGPVFSYEQIQDFPEGF
jgi:hypothetical protein